jgi:hypothetical protein
VNEPRIGRMRNRLFPHGGVHHDALQIPGLDASIASEFFNSSRPTNKITRRWAKRGTRPSARRDQRTASTYIFAAICPKQEKGGSLILPVWNSEAMNLHLAEIANAVAPWSHAVLPVDRAGWHLSARLPPLSRWRRNAPKLNPVENIWQYIRDNWLSNRVFKSYDDIVDHRCYAYNTLVDRPWKILSIGLRQSAYEF